MLADVFENFHNMSWNIWAWSCKIFFSSRIRMTSTHKNAKVKLDLLTDIYMLLIVEKGIKGEMCNSVYQYWKANNKYMKYYDKKRILIYSILGCK